MKNYFLKFKESLCAKIARKRLLKRWYSYKKEIPHYGYWSDHRHHYYSHLEPVKVVEDAIALQYKNPRLLQVHGITVEFGKDEVNVTIVTSRPGMIIGMHGTDIGELCDLLIEAFYYQKVHIDLKEVKSFREIY